MTSPSTTERPEKCPTCDDVGWYTDHEDACYEAGDCVGCGGVQVPCTDPRGHADPCAHCSHGQVWDPTAYPGPVAACHHCNGSGWIYRVGQGSSGGGTP